MPKRGSMDGGAPAKRKLNRRKPISRRRGNTKGDNVGSGAIGPRTATVSKQAKQARKLVMEAWTEIIQGLIKKAASGGTQQTKLLMELCDLAAMENPNLSEEQKEQFCDAVMAGWKLTASAAQANTTDVRNALDRERRADDSNTENE